MIASFFPLAGAALLTALLSQWAGWSAFYSNGEFCIYSASIMGGTLYILLKDVRVRFLQVVAILVLLADAVVIAAIAVQGLFAEQIELDRSLLIDVSVFVLVLTAGVALVTKISESIAPNLKKYRELSKDRLSDDFDNL